MPKCILYIHGISEIGGAEKDLLNLLEHIDKQQWDPIVVCPPNGPLLESVNQLKVPVYPMKLRSWRKFKDLLAIPFAVWSLSKLIRELGVDVVHVNDYWWGPVAYMASQMAQVPCIVHIRQEIEPRRIKQYWLKKPQRLIAISKCVRAVAVEAGVDSARVNVVYSGINPSQTVVLSEGKKVRDQYGLLPNQPVIGTVANLFTRKGYEYLIQALVEINQKKAGIHCLIVGEGDEIYRSRLLDMVQKNGLEKVITFAGFQRDVLSYIAAMDIFVLPSILEGFGIVLLEAMAMGKPIVATTVGGIPEIVEDQVTGFLVPPRDSSALAQKTIYLLENPSLREKLGQAGRARVFERFSVQRMASQLQDVYGELI
ncbi:MAG: glycosyltransferase family 4 protein [Nitrospira sp.]|nr:glycosyltransferase family 4 protein [Nitrospira sp.]